MPIIKVVKKLRIRKDASTLNAPLGVLNIGAILEVEGPIKGKAVPGTSNDSWYKDSKGYYWSGGVKIIEYANDYLKQVGLTNEEALSKTLEANRGKLRTFENVTAVSVGKDCIEVYVTTKQTKQLIPTRLFYTLPNGKEISFPIKIIKTEPFRAFSAFFPSAEIANSRPKVIGGIDTVGTYGCTVKRSSGEVFLLTCFHVVKHERHKWEEFIARGFEEVVWRTNLGNKPIGVIHEAFRNEFMDIALIKPYPNIELSGHIPPIGTPKITRVINSEDEKFHRKVRKRGHTTGLKNGKISKILYNVEVQYHDKTVQRFNKLISITASGDVFSLGGDSGAAVIDQHDYCIGIIVAGNRDISLALPAHEVFEKLKIELFG